MLLPNRFCTHIKEVSEDVRKWWGGQWVCREGLSQGRGNDQFVDETAQVTRCTDLELDEAASRPFMWMDVPSDLLVMFNTRCLFDISTFRNWFSGCQNSTWVDHEIPSFNVMLYGFWTCFQAWLRRVMAGQWIRSTASWRSYPSVFFLGDENRLLAELYMHRRLNIGIFLSLDNDNEMDIINFAGIKYHQTRQSSSKTTKCLHHRERPR